MIEEIIAFSACKLQEAKSLKFFCCKPIGHWLSRYKQKYPGGLTVDTHKNC